MIGIKASGLISSNQVSYQDKTVESALDELMEIADNCPKDALCKNASIGDYVQMTPTEPSYTILGELTGYKNTETGEYIDQTINPSELDLWRIIAINPDGTIEMISEYVSSSDLYFSNQEGFLDYVGSLNLIASQYGNSKYTVQTRHMGYNGQTSTITDKSTFTHPALLTFYTLDNSNESIGGGDLMDKRDLDLVKTSVGSLIANKVGTKTPAIYWNNSRLYAYGGEANYHWYGKAISSSGEETYYGFYGYLDGIWATGTTNCAIRPIVTIKNDVYATGLGTSDSPWVLS